MECIFTVYSILEFCLTTLRKMREKSGTTTKRISILGTNQDKLIAHAKEQGLQRLCRHARTICLRTKSPNLMLRLAISQDPSRAKARHKIQRNFALQKHFTTKNTMTSLTESLRPAHVPYDYNEGAERIQGYKPGGLHPTHIGDLLGQDGRHKVAHKLGHGGFGTVHGSVVISNRTGGEPSRTSQPPTQPDIAQT